MGGKRKKYYSALEDWSGDPENARP